MSYEHLMPRIKSLCQALCGCDLEGEWSGGICTLRVRLPEQGVVSGCGGSLDSAAQYLLRRLEALSA